MNAPKLIGKGEVRMLKVDPKVIKEHREKVWATEKYLKESFTAGSQDIKS